MIYIVEFWGKQASGEDFNGKLESKSENPKNWLGKMRKQFSQYDFNNVTEFQYRTTPLKDIKEAERIARVSHKTQE